MALRQSDTQRLSRLRRARSAFRAYVGNHGSKPQLGRVDVYKRQVSARVSAIGYRADMETALRTPDMAGYQLLSIQDFPGQGTAHVGILDNFMEDKPGGFTKEQYKSFNDSVVVLAQLPKLVLTNSEDLTGTISVVNYGPAALDEMCIRDRGKTM